MWRSLSIKMELLLSIWQEAQSVQKSTRQRKFVRMSYTNTPKVIEALKGIDTLLMVSAREKSRACQGAQGVFRCRKASGGAAYCLYLLLWGR